ncbi:1-phosphatidylinositol 4,5-bisphosphate phosphodiesterase epsilon-1, partial [Araneus ventricosus]
SALHLNTAMFEQNACCGYVRKPRVMWDRSHMMYGRFNPWEKSFDGFHALNLSITVISGQYVCPATFNGSPMVELDVIGIPVDCNRYKTKIVQRNSLNPIWNEVFNFRVTFVDLAFIRFSVMDMGNNHLTAQRVIPLGKIKQEIRQPVTVVCPYVIVTGEMLLRQEPFQVLEQMLIAESKIETIGGMVKHLPAKPLQKFLCMQRRMRTSVVMKQSPIVNHLF